MSGYHVRVSKELGDEIRKRFTVEIEGQTYFGIPYYIIAKNGQIALEDAPRPSKKDILYEELGKYK